MKATQTTRIPIISFLPDSIVPADPQELQSMGLEVDTTRAVVDNIGMVGANDACVAIRNAVSGIQVVARATEYHDVAVGAVSVDHILISTDII